MFLYTSKGYKNLLLSVSILKPIIGVTHVMMMYLHRYADLQTSGHVGRSLVVDVQLDDGSLEELPCGLVRLPERLSAKSFGIPFLDPKSVHHVGLNGWHL